MKPHRIVLLSAALVLFGCGWLAIASYDPALDSGVADLKVKVATFLNGLRECAGTPEGEYARHTGFYTEARADLANLRAIAEVHAGNERTLRSLESIGENLDELEAIHRSGVSSEEVAVIAQLFDTQFRMLAELQKAKQRKEED